MVKKILGISMVSAMLLLSGCGESDGESALETQKLLDEGNFAAVIAKVEPTASTDADYLALGAAYMGRAGVALPQLIDAVIKSGDDTSGDDAFVVFVQNISDKTKANSTALNDLTTASNYYKKVVATCSGVTLSDSAKDVCLYGGLAQTVKATTTISYLSDDVGALSGGVNADPKLSASTCAMQYAIDGSTAAGCSITSNGNITFTSTQKTYESITVNGSFEYLIAGATAPKRTVITNGYCALDSFTPRVLSTSDAAYNAATFHVCPVNENAAATDLTTSEAIVQALNDGTDSIGVAASEDMQKSIDEFKCEILGGSYNNNSCSVSLSQTVTEQQIIDYINIKN